MSRKHFRAIADAIRAIGDAGARRRAAIALADLLQTANPRFNRGQFIRACGVQPDEH